MEKFMGQLTGMIPFVLAVEGGGFRLNKTRIIEAVIVACIGGLAAGYIATREMSVEMANLKLQIMDVSKKIDCLDNRLWQHQANTEQK